MNKKIRLWLSSPVFLLMTALFTLAFLPMLIWHMTPSSQLNVWILNNTVPDYSYREHKGLMWTLNHFKITPPNQRYFKYHKDYYGFFPNKNKTYTVKDFANAPDFPDLIYLADSYGVYEHEYMNKNPLGERSPLIYGGLSEIDAFRIKSYLKNGVTLIGEFNTFTSPTSPLIRSELEEIFGFRWKGWIGRYFHDLSSDNEVAPWMIRNYENQYKRPWNFKGEGYALVSSNDKIIVLESAIDIGSEDCQILFRDQFKNEFNIKKPVPYYYWIEMIEPFDTTEILADFYLDLTERGREKLRSEGLSGRFPAIVRKKNSAYTSYYLAGDFADLTSVPMSWNYGGLYLIRKQLSMHIKGESNAFFWRAYVPFIHKVLNEIRHDPLVKDRQRLAHEKTYLEENQIKQISKTDSSGFYLYHQGTWKQLFIKAINLGTAQPGNWMTEFPSDESVYSRWFKMMADMNVNAVRVYTLLDPAFYRALYLYNLNHPLKPLYLLQGIWPQENPKNNNLLDKGYMENFLQEIQTGIDAIHGNADIPYRQGRAYGRYIANCSSFTLAYLIGREFEPHEVEASNKINSGYQYEGTYLQCTNGSPTEAWFAWSCDQTVEYETKKYHWQRPVSLVSWPTLDPLEHDSEWNEDGDKHKEWNDSISIDINHIQTSNQLKAGFFGSYHIYPNFPDFMNNELSFYDYHDREGRFLYGGYLKAFIEQHSKYPALVAEFGLATGMGNAHKNPDGYQHGGLSEKEQGLGIIRMFKNIHALGYMGGVIFEWMDEWAKKTWTTEPFILPFERNVLWHNTICPEQNYGILANVALEPEKADFEITQNDLIEQLALKTDASYFYIDLHFKRPIDLSKEELIIGIDTYDRDRGEFYYFENANLRAPSGMEFKASFKDQDALLQVIPSYNISKMNYQSKKSFIGVFEMINPIINKRRIRKDGSIIHEIRENGSLLYQGKFDESLHHYFWTDNHKQLRLRLPWGRLNVTDPSSHRVLDDPRSMLWHLHRDQYQTLLTDGFVISAIIVDQSNKELLGAMPNNIKEVNPYQWKGWEFPLYMEKVKKSYPILRDFLASFP